MSEHKYFCTAVRPSVNRLPQEGLLYVEAWKNQKYVRNIGALARGYAVYSRPLSDAD